MCWLAPNPQKGHSTTLGDCASLANLQQIYKDLLGCIYGRTKKHEYSLFWLLIVHF
jgi:hypothetical protein